MTLIITEAQWAPIYRQIALDYGQATVIISWRLRDTLGFRVRRHRWWNEQNVYEQDIRLDFDSESQAVFFQLKYL